MNQGLVYIQIQVLQPLSLCYCTFGPRHNFQRRTELLKSEAAWSGWAGPGHLVFWYAQSCGIVGELCLQVKQLWEEVHKLWGIWKDKDAIKWQFSETPAKILPGQGRSEKCQAWLKGRGAVMKSLGLEVVQLGSVTEGRVWVWLGSLRLFPVLRNQRSRPLLWKAWTLPNAVWGASTS